MHDRDRQEVERIEWIYGKLSVYSSWFQSYAEDVAQGCSDSSGKLLVSGKLLCMYALRLLKEGGFAAINELPDLFDCTFYSDDREDRNDIFFMENQNTYAADMERLFERLYHMGGWTIDSVAMEQIVSRKEELERMEPDEIDVYLEAYLQENPRISYLKELILQGLLFGTQGNYCWCDKVVSLSHPVLFAVIRFLEDDPDICREDRLADLFLKLYHMATMPVPHAENMWMQNDGKTDSEHIVFLNYTYEYEYEHTDAFLLNPLHLAAAAILQEVAGYLVRKYRL